MMEKFTIYCDVDGVFNVYHNSEKLNKIIVKRKLPSLGLYLPKIPLPFKWYEDISNDFVNRILSKHSPYLHWLTTWNHDAITIVEPLTGIKSTSYIEYRMTLKETTTQAYKYDLLKNHQRNNPTPFIWIDDIATKNYKEQDWLEHPKHLVIQPSTKYGLTLENIETMERFISEII